ncbi:MAG: metal ABC transporter permease [Kiritimatiellia bacterium]|nr:metal ABC transporter permease [Lentisphaerota bacterium]
MEHCRTLLELFPHAVVAGVLIAAVCAALGVYVILKRIVFIGVALAESAACGIALAMTSGVPPFIGAAALTLGVGLGLSRPYESGRLPRDALLGVIFVAAAALSILLVSKAGLGLEEIRGLLYGDLVLARPGDLLVCVAVLVPAALVLLIFRRPVLYSFLDREVALLLGIKAACWEILFFAVLALTVAAAARVAGAMLVFAYLVVAPAAALLLSRRLAVVLRLAVGVAVTCTLLGLYLALAWDLPANQLIVALMCLCLALVAAGKYLRRLFQPVK